MLHLDFSTTFPARRALRSRAGVRAWFAGTAATALLLAVTRADIDLPTVPPPQPAAVTARTFVGEPVEIPLSGVSRSGRPLEFVIRKRPEAGTLSEIVPQTRTRATVTYTPAPHGGPGVDRFRYAVRAPGIGVSTPAEVIIHIAERPARFVAPAVLDFGAVAVGQTASREIELRNDGGGVVEGAVTVPPPWSLVASNGRYALGPGQSRTFIVSFAPSEPRRFAGQGSYSHAEGIGLGLEGRGYAPVETVPREVRLEADGRNETRTGEFIVRNVSEAPRTLLLQLPTGVQGPARVEIGPRAETTVQLTTAPGVLTPLASEIKLVEGDFVLAVPLRVAAAPPRLTADPSEIDLGTFAAGRYGRTRIRLRNVGGSPADLRATLPPGLTVTPDPTIVALAPGEEREFEISYAQPSAGKLDSVVELTAGGLGVRLPVRANIVESNKLSAQAGASGPGTVPPPGEAGSAAPPRPIPTADIPPVEQIGVTRQTRTEVDLAWKKSSPSAVRYAVVMREISFNEKGQAVFRFVPLERVKPRFVRDEVRASLAGLRPGESVTLHVVGYDAAGNPSPPSPPFTIFSKPAPPFRFPWFWLGALVLIVCVAVIIRERRRARRALEASVEHL